MVGDVPHEPQEAPMDRTRKAIITAAAAVGVGVGGFGIATAATGGIGGEDDDLPVDGSIAVQEDEAESDADETARYEGLATVSQADAEAAALAEVPGTIGEVELDEEGGSLVYDVE